LRLGHRSSEDFDFFSSQPFDPGDLQRRLPWAESAEVTQIGVNTLTLRVDRDGPVKVSFFGGLTIGRIGSPEPAAPHGLLIASLEDLFATKLKVLVQRAEAKDYLDIDAILRAGLPLELGLAAAAALYAGQLQPALPLRALGYFEDGDLPSLPEQVKTRLVAATANVRDLPAVWRVSETVD
jgi:hypothetical protein